MSTEKIRVVLDTNVIISATVVKEGTCAGIVEALVAGKFENFTAKEIIDEINLVLKRPRIQKFSSEEYRMFILEWYLKKSSVVVPVFYEKAVTDESDDKFINCALTANADVVSGDNHLLTLKNFRNVKIISPKEFLDSL